MINASVELYACCGLNVVQYFLVNGDVWYLFFIASYACWCADVKYLDARKFGITQQLLATLSIFWCHIFYLRTLVCQVARSLA